MASKKAVIEKGTEERLAFTTAAAWEAWLAKNHGRPDGITMRLAKLKSGIPSVTYPDALDVALCYGWIDAVKGRESDTHYTQRFTPRRARSIWSKVNRDKVAALIASGRMKPAGLAEIERAKTDGRWDAAYGGFSAKDAIPDDLGAALAKSRKAKAFFETLNSQNRYAILFRLHQAKRPETRDKRLGMFVAMLEKGETIYPQKPGKSSGAGVSSGQSDGNPVDKAKKTRS
ncbi:MAG: YdeI/OmpD-associated family protein [Gemmatimonadaceae bacterium]